MTMYKLPQRWLVDNPIDRYSIGSATPGLKTADNGSISIYVQAKSPGQDKETQVCNTQFMGLDRGSVPGFPLIVEISKVKREKIKFRGVLHKKRQGCFESVPMFDG